MKRRLAFVLTCVLAFVLPSLVASPSFATFEDCDCIATDGSCSASISCQGPCTRFCGNGGNCYAECSGDYGFLGAETTLELQNATYPQLITALAHQSGKQV